MARRSQNKNGHPKIYLMAGEIRAFELYSGIGGFHHSLKASGIAGTVCVAVDINPTGNETYKLNFPETVLWQKNTESLSVNDIEKLDINFIWMSPPCQPFTRLGKEMDCSDTRTSSFLHIMNVISKLNKKPLYIGLENVKGFEESQTRHTFIRTLDENGYEYQIMDNFPVELLNVNHATAMPCLGEFLQLEPEFYFKNYLLPDDILLKHFGVLDIVDEESKGSCCFTKGYTHYVKGTGSVIQVNRNVKVSDIDIPQSSPYIGSLDVIKSLQLRYFSPKEIANILGFPKQFGFPSSVTRRQQYRLLGNSLNVTVVSHILRLCLP